MLRVGVEIVWKLGVDVVIGKYVSHFAVFTGSNR
jgi:hypothetical protein